ncbi:MAG TPA: hypothetical protein VNK04_20440 [Gemmataceae bacterium]|nr:hypothetical protein [Gemmataceae bacterium]
MKVAILLLRGHALRRLMTSFLHARSARRVPVLLLGLLLAQDRRRTVTSWFHAAAVGHDFPPSPTSAAPWAELPVHRLSAGATTPRPSNR